LHGVVRAIDALDVEVALPNAEDVLGYWQMTNSLPVPSLRIPVARGRTCDAVVGTLNWQAGPP
jgi:hypothetical protein